MTLTQEQKDILRVVLSVFPNCEIWDGFSWKRLVKA